MSEGQEVVGRGNAMVDAISRSNQKESERQNDGRYSKEQIDED